MAEATDGSSLTSQEVLARDELLRLVQEMSDIDRENLLEQALLDASSRQAAPIATWATIREKVMSRVYRTHTTISADLGGIITALQTVDKKKARLSRSCAFVAAKMKKFLAANELQLRKHMCFWHTHGLEGTKADEALERQRAQAELQAQRQLDLQQGVLNSLTSGCNPKMKDMSDMVKRILERTQYTGCAVHAGPGRAAVAEAVRDCDHFRNSDLEKELTLSPPASALLSPVEWPVFRRVTVLNAQDGVVASHRMFPPAHAERREPSAKAPKWKALRRAAQWKAYWLQMRLADLDFQERQLTMALQELDRQSASQGCADAAAPTLASNPRPHPMLHNLSQEQLVCTAFTADAVRQHPFFREVVAAVQQRDADVLCPPPAGAVRDCPVDPTEGGVLHTVLCSLYERAFKLADCLSDEMGVRASNSFKPGVVKIPRKGSRGLSRSNTLGNPFRADSSRDNRRRRVGESLLPATVLNFYTKKRTSEIKFVPTTRRLAPEEIAARLDAESDTGDDEDGSDAFYMRLHRHEVERLDRETTEKARRAGQHTKLEQPGNDQNLGGSQQSGRRREGGTAATGMLPTFQSASLPAAGVHAAGSVAAAAGPTAELKKWGT